MPGFSVRDRGQSPWDYVGLSFIVPKRGLAAGRWKRDRAQNKHLKVKIQKINNKANRNAKHEHENMKMLAETVPKTVFSQIQVTGEC